MSGTLQRCRNSKRSWRSLWFLLKDKVLYTYPQPEVMHTVTFFLTLTCNMQLLISPYVVFFYIRRGLHARPFLSWVSLWGQRLKGRAACFSCTTKALSSTLSEPRTVTLHCGKNTYYIHTIQQFIMCTYSIGISKSYIFLKEIITFIQQGFIK